MVEDFPLVSVILPTYNRVRFLERSIHSVMKQTYRNWELIVIDDGSTDDTKEYITKNITHWNESLSKANAFQPNVMYCRTENKGVSSARNFGISQSKGEWISFLDSDDEWDPKKILKQIQFHRDNPSLSFSQTNEIWNKKGNSFEPKGKFKKLSGFYLKESLKTCMITTSSFFAKREIYESIGGFREELKSCEDYDLWNRIFVLGYEIGLLEENLLTRYGGHDDQLSMQYKAMERFRLYSLFLLYQEVKTKSNNLTKDTLLEISEVIELKLDVFLRGRQKRQSIPSLDEKLTTLWNTKNISKEALRFLLEDSLFP